MNASESFIEKTHSKSSKAYTSRISTAVKPANRKSIQNLDGVWEWVLLLNVLNVDAGW